MKMQQSWVRFFLLYLGIFELLFNHILVTGKQIINQNGSRESLLRLSHFISLTD